MEIFLLPNISTMTKHVKAYWCYPFVIKYPFSGGLLATQGSVFSTYDRGQSKVSSTQKSVHLQPLALQITFGKTTVCSPLQYLHIPLCVCKTLLNINNMTNSSLANILIPYWTWRKSRVECDWWNCKYFDILLQWFSTGLAPRPTITP